MSRDYDAYFRMSRLIADTEAPPRCGETPKGLLSTVPLWKLTCVEPPHGAGVQHRNLNGDVWPETVERAIDRVPERRR